MSSRIDKPYLMAHLDKVEYSLDGDWRIPEKTSKAMSDVALELQDISSYEISDHNGSGNYRRMKRLRSDDGLIDIYYHRRREVPAYIDTAGFIRVSSSNKVSYAKHHDVLDRLEDILQEYEVDWLLRSAEISYDTADRDTGLLVRTKSVPARFQCGCTIIGDTLYQHEPRATRRFKYYAREQHGQMIYRAEISFNREWINDKKYRHAGEILRDSGELGRQNIRLMEPLNDVLVQDWAAGRIYKWRSKWSIDDIIKAHEINTALGLQMLLDRPGMTQRKALGRYYRPIELPPIRLAHDKSS